MAEEDLSMETILRLAQQLQGAPPPPVNTAAPQNELGLLGRLFGGGGGGLSTEQQEMQARQAMMAFGSQLSQAASRPLQYGERRDFMAGLGEANQAAWGTSAAYAKQARDQAKEDREERRAQFNDRMSALDAASKIGKMQADLQALRLKRTSLDEPGTGTTGAGGGGAGGGGGGPPAPQFTGDLEQDRQLIIKRESGGDPTALNYVAKADPAARAKGATASGLYGFVDSTWREGLQMIGGDAKAYPTAQSAPKEVQDKVFDAIYKARGTAPWDPSKWGQNWVKNDKGGYDLVKTGTGGATTAGTTPPPYKVAGPPQPPPGAPAATPAVPGAPAPAPATPEQPALPESEARAKAAATGQPVPMLGSDGKPSGLVIKPDGSMANAPPPGAPPPGAPPPGAPPPTATAPGATPPAADPLEYQTWRAANLRQPTPEERRLFSGELTEADRVSVQQETARLERALQNAQRARQLEGGDASTIVAAQTKLAEHQQRVREAAAVAAAKGKEIEVKWWADQEAQLRAAHKEVISHRNAVDLETLRSANKRQENVDTAVTSAASERVKELQGRAGVAQRMIRNTQALEAFVGAMGDPNALVANNKPLRDWLITLNMPGLVGATMGELRASQVWDRLVTSFAGDVKVPSSGSTSDKEGEWMMSQFGGPEQTIEDRYTQLSIIRKLAQNRIDDHTDAADMFQGQNGKLVGLDKKIAERSKLFDRPPAWKPEEQDNMQKQSRYAMRHPRGEPYAAYTANGQLRYYRNEMVKDATGRERLEPRPLLGGSMVAE